MSRLFARIARLFSNRKFAGVDEAGNNYFCRNVELDGVIKEKRWVVFTGDEDPTSIPVEWICWLNGQRKRAPTPEEIRELEERRERVRENVALLKKEEEQRKAKEASEGKRTSPGKVRGPDLKSFIQQLQGTSEGDEIGTSSTEKDKHRAGEDKKPVQDKPEPMSSEPTGSGATFKPGTWQPPT